VHADGPAASPTAELRLVAATGGAPIVLARASHQLGAMAQPGLGDTMPAWAPDGTWLAFASTRAYGAVRPMGPGLQIWIAAVDPSRAGDPSFAAFWLSAQDVTASNVTPAWGPTAATTTQ
jgi:hypothetical protein